MRFSRNQSNGLPFVLAYLAIAFGWNPCMADVISIPVLVHPLQAGQEIQKADFTTKEYEVSASARYNYVIAAEQLAGAIALRSIPAGRPIPVSTVGAPPVVSKGKSTAVRYEQDGIEIDGILIPTKDGRPGDVVVCRNPASGLLVNATVAPDGGLVVAVQ